MVDGGGDSGRIASRDDAVRRLEALGASSGRGGASDEVAPIRDWIDDRERVIKKRELDFATVIETASQVGAKGLDPAKIEAYAMTMLMGQFGFLRAVLLRQVDFAGTTLAVAGRHRRLEGLRFDAASPLGHALIERAEPVATAALPADDACVRALAEAGIEILLPLVIRERGLTKGGTAGAASLKGCIGVGQRVGGRFLEPGERELLGLLGHLIAISLHNAQLYHRSIVDGLTGVYRRGYFDLRLEQEIDRAARAHEALGGPRPDGEATRPRAPSASVTLVMLDIDHFKQVNDRHGHLAGDAVLRHVARFLEGQVRGIDLVARYGGEEFALVLPETAKADALTLTERLRVKLHQQRIDGGAGELSISASFGVASYPDDAPSVRGLIALADQALYAAKAAGRNRVCAAPAERQGDRHGA